MIELNTMGHYSVRVGSTSCSVFFEDKRVFGGTICECESYLNLMRLCITVEVTQ